MQSNSKKIEGFKKSAIALIVIAAFCSPKAMGRTTSLDLQKAHECYKGLSFKSDVANKKTYFEDRMKADGSDHIYTADPQKPKGFVMSKNETSFLYFDEKGIYRCQVKKNLSVSDNCMNFGIPKTAAATKSEASDARYFINIAFAQTSPALEVSKKCEYEKNNYKIRGGPSPTYCTQALDENSKKQIKAEIEKAMADVFESYKKMYSTYIKKLASYDRKKKFVTTTSPGSAPNPEPQEPDMNSYKGAIDDCKDIVAPLAYLNAMRHFDAVLAASKAGNRQNKGGVQ
jgi:hypothetical protein